MADSVDRVFVHALNTVKKIPRTGSARPPPADRLRLYGLYKQAMEGDVDGVMERPGSGSSYGGNSSEDSEELRKEREKWDAWDACKGLGKTEAKRRYIESLIGTMHKYASSTADARELVAELEFVWDQIKNNSASSGASSARTSPLRGASYDNQNPPSNERRFTAPRSGNDGPMRVLSPMSQDDEEEGERERRLGLEDNEDENAETNNTNNNRVSNRDQQNYEDEYEEGRISTRKWRRKVEMALVRMTAEMAALREQIATGREYRGQRRRTIGAWMSWLVWVSMKHFLVDVVLLWAMLIWLRRKKERRLEDLVREWLRSLRGRVRRIVPSRPVR